jgi:mRNA interferase MazF
LRVQVQKWGNSLALRIPKPFAQDAEVREGTLVDVSLSEGKLVVAPVRKKETTLKQVLSKYTEQPSRRSRFGAASRPRGLVMARRYIPSRGDVVWLSFTPQAERRPALVISPASYNGKVGIALFCPITSQVKGYPFEVSIPDGLQVSGVVLSDQTKSLDWRARKAEFVCKVPQRVR